jgi:DNA-binding transcriptional regulator YiaG
LSDENATVILVTTSQATKYHKPELQTVNFQSHKCLRAPHQTSAKCLVVLRKKCKLSKAGVAERL